MVTRMTVQIDEGDSIGRIIEIDAELVSNTNALAWMFVRSRASVHYATEIGGTSSSQEMHRVHHQDHSSLPHGWNDQFLG
jgi:hypothetical protein